MIGIRGVEMFVVDSKADWISHYGDINEIHMLAIDQQRVQKGGISIKHVTTSSIAADLIPQNPSLCFSSICLCCI